MAKKSQPASVIEIESLIKKEGWEIIEKEQKKYIIAYGEEHRFVHPVAIHNKIYRIETNPERRFLAMKAIHDYYWPDQIKTWNYWEEERFIAHCEGWSFISLAGPASSAKSHTAGKIVLIHYFSNPEENAAIVASTTLSALKKRVFGYIIAFVHEIKVPRKFIYTKNPNPEIKVSNEEEIHCISALAAGVGTDENQIKNYIGRHPKSKMLLILDEAPDLSPVVRSAVANLKAGRDGKLQVWIIGNSKSKSDLHGAMSTPEGGDWLTVNPEMTRWRTTQPNGICIYNSPYRSPAIHETDPEKRYLFEGFFITLKQIEDNKREFGENSSEFWRMTLAWWQDLNATDRTFTDKPFLENYRVQRKSLWSGLHPLQIVGGLDPAFSAGGDKCILRLAILGQSSSGQVVLDFRDKSLLFVLKMQARHKDSIEIQLADQVIQLLKANKCNLQDVTVDCTGQGRAFPELIRQRAAAKFGIQWGPAIKVMSARNSNNKNNSDVLVRTPRELWDEIKNFIQTNQICGLDDVAVYQMCNRKLVYNEKTKKTVLEDKLAYRNRMSAITPGKGTSPDEADAASLALFTAIHRHGFYQDQVMDLSEKRDFFMDKLAAMHSAQIVEETKAKEIGLKATFNSGLGGKIVGPWGQSR